MTKQERDELRRVAEAANTVGHEGESLHWEDDADYGIWTEAARVVAKASDPDEAAHIAAFDPPTALALLDELERGLAKRDENYKYQIKLENELTAARAEIERLESLSKKYANKFCSITSEDGSGHADIGAALIREVFNHD